MTRGGRGYSSRGGSSRGSSYRGGGSSYRGGYRGSSDHGSSYNDRDSSRSRYSGGGGGGGGHYGDSRSSRYDSSDRYSRQDRQGGGGGYKRNDSYKDSRDRRSPDRKRPRAEHSSQGGGGGRRDYGAGSSGGDYHRRDSSGGRGGSSSRYHDAGGSSSSYDKRGNDHHHSSSSVGSGGAGGGGGRDRMDNRSSSRGRGGDRSREPMGPPRSVGGGPRNSGGGAGGYRGGPPVRSSLGSRSMGASSIRRGSTRGRIASNSRFRNDGRRGIMTSRLPPNRRDFRGGPPLRKRFTTIRTRGSIAKRTFDPSRNLTRKALIQRALAAAKELDDDQTTENEGEDDEEMDDDKDTTTGAEGDAEVKKEHDEDEEDDGDKTVKDEEEEEEEEAEGDKTVDTEKDGEDKEDESKEGEEGEGGEKKEAPSTPKKSVKKAVAAKAKSSPGGDDKDGEKKKKDTKITTKYRASSYIKLNCCHCGTKCVTFKEYQSHLFRGLHRAAMRRVGATTRDKLMEMRQTQRAAQKEEDEKVDDASEQKSSYCPLCQLNFRQPKAVHQKSDGHKEMKRFLMPYCATCKIGFKSPMAYEAHRCSLEHLKFKARMEKYANKEDSGEDGGEFNLENFTTVDEVGDVDEPTDSIKDSASTPKKAADNKSTGRPGTDDEDDESDDIEDETVIGGEHCKKVEVHFCDLCQMYLPRRDDPEKAVRTHCKSRLHLKLYIRQREDKKLRERAERIHKKKLSDAKAKKDAKKEASASEADLSEKADTSEKKSGEEGETKDATTDDQMWEVVDNDLGDLLREVSGPPEEEEEDDEKTSSERYDKFKHTEKNGIDQSTGHDSTAEEEELSDKKAAVKKAANGDANGADKEVKVEP